MFLDDSAWADRDLFPLVSVATAHTLGLWLPWSLSGLSGAQGKGTAQGSCKAQGISMSVTSIPNVLCAPSCTKGSMLRAYSSLSDCGGLFEK